MSGKVIIIQNRPVLYWNTFRRYTSDGQRIIATPIHIKEEDAVVFVDMDRNIDGVVDFCPLLSDPIMKAYDVFTYRWAESQNELATVRFLQSIQEEMKEWMKKEIKNGTK